jgi:uncharacterized NAD(P)/FAD-binding protein YdhS
MVAVNLARRSPVPLQIALIDRRNAFACGAAFSTTRDEHVLNVAAAGMSAFPDAPSDFVRWLRESPMEEVDGSAFLPRAVYARYLHSLLEEASGGRHRIERMNLDVVDLRHGDDGAVLVARDGAAACRARSVVLALGSLAPPRPPAFGADARYVSDPRTFLREPSFDAAGDTLVIGTGLTALDVILSFQRSASRGRIVALSRRGRFPLPHSVPAAPPRDPFAAGPLPTTAREALARVRSAANAEVREGRDWRAVVDGLRPRTADVWDGFSMRERRRFLRHARSVWESHRHRAPVSSLAVKDDMIARGKLIVLAGRLIDADDAGDAIEVRYRARGSAEPQRLRVAAVINCTGPSTDYAAAESLVANLAASGGVVCDDLGMGLQARRDGRLVDAAGNVHERLRAIGWPLRGALYETTAVRELREQAHSLATDLVELLTSVGTASSNGAGS